MMPDAAHLPAGIGLRQAHFDEILKTRPSLGFLEVHSENFFVEGGPNLFYLTQLRQHYPISLHGVGLSLGSSDGICNKHLNKLKRLVKETDPFLISEHISWSGINGTHVPDLLPLPMTNDALNILCNNIDRVQNALGRKILVENPSSYLSFAQNDMSEPEFLKQIAKRSGCCILLDINNVYVSAHNTGFNAEEYLEQIPQHLVGEIHLAGYSINKTENTEVFIDTHGEPVHQPVWALFKTTCQRMNHNMPPVLLEWDTNIPPLSTLLAQAHKANKLKAPAL